MRWRRRLLRRQRRSVRHPLARRYAFLVGVPQDLLTANERHELRDLGLRYQSLGWKPIATIALASYSWEPR